MNEYDSGVGGRLIKAFENNAAAHAYIVSGEKAHIPSLLRQCAAVVLCPSHAEDNCAVCRKVIDGSHQDWISLPSDKAKNKITADDVAYLVGESVKRPVDKGDVRVFTLDASLSAAGAGSAVWQNKLLKTLEEPLEGIYLFIGVTDPDSLLRTVVSRCQVITESKMSAAEVRGILIERGYDADWAETAAAMSGGNVDNAEKLLADPAVFEAYRTAEEMLVGMTSTKVALRYVAEAAALKEKTVDFLAFASLLLRESVAARLCPSLCLLPSKKVCAAQIGANYSIQAAEACVELLNAAKKRLDDGGNITAVLDNLTISMLEVKYRCRI